MNCSAACPEAAAALPAAGRRPLFLKVAPDLEEGEVRAIADSVAAHGLSGVVVSNTTISRPGLRSARSSEAGGLSGAPLFELSTAVLRRFADAATDASC
jgi:dihydroorotate dehydrogenase